MNPGQYANKEQEIQRLKDENARLRDLNGRLKAGSLRFSSFELKAENARLQKELEEQTSLCTRYALDLGNAQEEDECLREALRERHHRVHELKAETWRDREAGRRRRTTDAILYPC